MLVSLVITTYNRAELLAAALDSVAASRLDNHADIEVIVVDNNSTDGTRKTVEKFQAANFPFALRYVLETNQGLSHARNRGIDESIGTYVAFMDDDQLLDKNYLSLLAPAFASTRATCIGGPIHLYNKPISPRWLPPWLEYVGHLDFGDEIKILGPNDKKLTGGNMAFDRQELINAGKYDVSLGRCGASLLAGEEFELEDRLHAAGKRIVYHPSLIQYHYFSPARLTKHYWRRYCFDHGRTIYRTRILESGSHHGASALGVPRWLWRQLLAKQIPQAAWSLKSFDSAVIFERQLDVWTCLGQIHEARTHANRRKNVK